MLRVGSGRETTYWRRWGLQPPMTILSVVMTAAAAAAKRVKAKTQLKKARARICTSMMSSTGTSLQRTLKTTSFQTSCATLSRQRSRESKGSWNARLGTRWKAISTSMQRRAWCCAVRLQHCVIISATTLFFAHAAGGRGGVGGGGGGDGGAGGFWRICDFFCGWRSPLSAFVVVDTVAWTRCGSWGCARAQTRPVLKRGKGNSASELTPQSSSRSRGSSSRHGSTTDANDMNLLQRLLGLCEHRCVWVALGLALRLSDVMRALAIPTTLRTHRFLCSQLRTKNTGAIAPAVAANASSPSHKLAAAKLKATVSGSADLDDGDVSKLAVLKRYAYAGVAQLLESCSLGRSALWRGSCNATRGNDLPRWLDSVGTLCS